LVRVAEAHEAAFFECTKTHGDEIVELPKSVTCFEDVKKRFKKHGLTLPSALYHGSSVGPEKLVPIAGCEGRPTLASPKARGVFGNKGVKKWGDPYTWANARHKGMLDFLDSHYGYLKNKQTFYIYVITSNDPSYNKFFQYRVPKNRVIPFGLSGDQEYYAISAYPVQFTYCYKAIFDGVTLHKMLVWSASEGFIDN
jgi:hypothetical protein